MDNLYKAFCSLTNTPRFNTTRLLAPYSVADHTTRVMYLALRLAEEFPVPGVNVELVLKGALFHDLEESEFGDIKTPAKRFIKGYEHAAHRCLKESVQVPDLYMEMWNESRGSTVEADIIRLADMLEAFITSAYELERGNKSLRACYTELNKALKAKEIEIKKYYPYAQFLIEKARADVGSSSL